MSAVRRLLLRGTFVLVGSAIPVAYIAAFAGCSSDTKPGPPPLVVSDDDAAKGDAKPTDPPDTALPPPADGGLQGTIFTQTGRDLHIYDPYARTLKRIGSFSCLPSEDVMLDIAVDRDSNIYGATLDDRFVRIDPVTAQCTIVRTGTGLDYPILLAFVPRGTLDPANDALVGFDFDDNYLRIDTTTGAITKVGTLNPPDASTPYAASGDLIAAGPNGMFLTATIPGIPRDAGDSFVKFDPKTGRRLALVGQTGYDRLFGLGYWGGKIFGFTTPGDILQLDPKTAKATLVRRVDAGPDAGTVFYGAGSTTVAPETPVVP